MIPHEGPQVKEWLNGKCGQWQMLNLQLWSMANIDELQMNNGKCWIANDELQMLSCNCARAAKVANYNSDAQRTVNNNVISNI